MAISNNNVQNVKFLRNGNLFTTRAAARTALEGFELTYEKDGTAILARYGSDNAVKTLVGWVYANNSGNKSITIFDIDDAGTDAKAYVDSLVGSGITSANTATAQLEALSGSSNDTSATTSVAGAKKYTDDKITETVNGLDVNAITAPSGAFINAVSEADGKISASTAYMPTVSAISAEGQAITAVSQSNGTVSATAGDIAAAHVTVADSGELFTATTVEAALAEIAAEIDAMDKSASAEDGKVVTTVSETDGKVSETKANVKDLQLGGYSKSSSTGAIASTDTVNEALSKLENALTQNNVSNSDKSINITPAQDGSSTDINVNIKSGEHVLAKDGGNGVYTNIAISAVTGTELSSLGTNVAEAYKLVGTHGTKLGEYVKIYKDSSLVNLYLGHVDDLLSGTTAQTEESESSVVVPGSGSEALVWIVQLADGNYKLAAVDVESFLQESEFKDGLQVSNHEVSVKVDSTSEAVTTGESATANVLSVSSEGVKVGNIQAAIDYKVSTLDATVGSTAVTSGNHVAVQVSEADGVLTTVTVTEDDIASAQGLANEITVRTAADTELSNRLGTGVTTANTATAQLAALVGTSSDTKDSSSIVGAKKYADDKVATVVEGLNASVTGGTTAGTATSNHIQVVIDEANGVLTAVTVSEANIASASDLTNEIAARKLVDGQNGDTYAANTTKTYISGATSLNDADIKLNDALKALSDETVNQVKVNNVALTETNNAVNIQISAAAGTGAETTPITVATNDSTGAVTLKLESLDCGTY